MCFRPQSIPTKPQDPQQITAPRNDGQTFKKPLAPKQTALNSSSTKHGNTPYERNKQASSHIPYVGKKRATGSLKAPVSKGSYTGQEKGNTLNNENKPQTQSKIGQPIKRLSSNLTQPVAPKPPINAQEAANTSSDHKPVRRQIISDAAASAPVKKSSGGKQLKSIAKPLSGVAQLASGIVQPRSQSQNTSRSSNNTLNNMSGGRALSRSLQTIPQNIKTKLQPKQGMSSKYASEESLSKNPNRTIQSNSSNLPPARQNGGMEGGKFGFKAPSNFRPRAVSQTLNKTVHMSTPCQPTTVKRDELKVSPIVTGTTTVETTQASDKSIVDSKNRTLNVSLNQERPEGLILDTEKELVAQLNFSNHSQDLSYDQSHNVSGGQSNGLLIDQTTTKKVEDTRTNLLGTTTLLLDDVMNKGNNTDFFNQTVIIRKPSNEMSFEDEKEISNEANKTFAMNQLNRTHAVESDLNQIHTKEIPLNKTRILDQSDSLDLNKTHVLDTVPSDFSKTHVLNNHANTTQDIYNESNGELEKEMKVLYETFPVNEKSLAAELQEQIDEHISQSFSNSGNIPESEFIENVAMPSNLGKDTPCKSEIDDLNMEHSFTEDIAKVIAAISSGVGTHASASMVVSTSPLKSATTENEVTNVNVCSHSTVNHLTSEKVKHFLDIPITKSRTRESSENSDVFHDDEDFALVEVPKTPTHSSNILPKTPSKTDTFCDYDARFDKRCNTVSLGMVKRPRNVRRHFTLGAQDLSKLFRAPKEMHTRETLEGNILMDNTTFLQLSNDVRSVKTQLLKLKRTLQEVSSSLRLKQRSDLMKMPL